MTLITVLSGSLLRVSNKLGIVSSRLLRRIGVVMAATALVGAGAGVAAPEVSAADFYTPPAELGDSPGEVLRSERQPLFLQIPGWNNQWPGDAKRIMYTSTLQDGSQAAVTGTVVEPTAPWTGGGPRPTVVLGPGTIGQGDQCAGSKMLSFPISVDLNKPSLGANYSALSMNTLLTNGVRVAITDYVGLGTPGIHTYVNRLESGRAMLDAARAALDVSGAPADSPIGFSGYSQGGHAAASAAELAETYAPELNVKATYAGAPPADMSKVLPQIDGTLIMGAIAYAINGLADRYPEVKDLVERETNARGKAVLRAASTQCIADTALTYGLQRTSTWTTSGKSLTEIITADPRMREIMAEQRLGSLKPNAPVLLASSNSDDVIPNEPVRQLQRDWQALGADVRFLGDDIPPIFPGLIINHVIPTSVYSKPSMNFLLSQLAR